MHDRTTGLALFRPVLLGLLVAASICAAVPMMGAALADDLAATVQTGPAARASERERLFGFLANAQTAAEGRAVEAEIWHLWLQAPDALGAELMNEALRRRKVYDLSGALAVLDRIVARAPGWAEAWNQRAIVRFGMGDLEGALDDIERTVQLEPKHFGAMAGQAIILMRTGRFEAAQSVLREAVSIHPFLAERSMILPADEGDERRI